MNLPTSLTLLRIFLVPLLVAVLLAPPLRLWDKPFFGESSPPLRELVGVSVFLLAALTDFLDGFVARRRNQVTTLGTLLDPIADKLLTSAAFISLVQMPRQHLPMNPGASPEFLPPVAPAWMVVIIVGRDFAVSGLRSVLALRGYALPASIWGKLKTLSEIIAIVLLIFTNTLDRLGQYSSVGIVALWQAMLLALFSGGEYLWKFIKLAPWLTESTASRPGAQDGAPSAGAENAH